MMKCNTKTVFSSSFLMAIHLYAVENISQKKSFFKAHFNNIYTHKSGRSIYVKDYGIAFQVDPKLQISYQKHSVHAKGRNKGSYFDVDVDFYGLKTSIDHFIGQPSSINYEWAHIGPGRGQTNDSTVLINSFNTHTLELKLKPYLYHSSISLGGYHKLYAGGIGFEKTKQYSFCKLKIGGKAMVEYRSYNRKSNLSIKPYLYALGKMNLNKNIQVNIGGHIMPLGIPYTGTPLRGLTMAIVREEGSLVQKSRKEFNVYLSAELCIKI